MQLVSGSRPVSRAQTVFALAVIYVVWGSTYLAIRYAIQTIPPFLMGGSRFMLAGLILFGYLKLKGHSTPPFREWRSALIVGTLLLLGGNGFVVWAEETVESGLAAIMVSVAPLWMVFFEWIGPTRRHLRPLVLVGLFLGFSGVVLLMGPRLFSAGLTANSGFLLLALAPILWGYGSIQSKRLPLPSSAFMATALEMLLGGAVQFMAGVFLGEVPKFSVAVVSKPSAVAFIYLVLVGSLVGFSAFIWLITNVPIPIASTYAYVNPVVAVFLGWLIAGERLTSRTLSAGALVLLAVGLITTGERSRQTSGRR